MGEIEIKTYGCSMNRGASEIAAGILSEKGYKIKKGGKILIINTCTVKTPTENKIIKLLNSLRNTEKRIIVAGCLPAADPNVVEKFPGYSFLGTNLQDIVEAVEAAEEGKQFIRIGRSECVLGKPRTQENNVIGIVPISEGCLGNCNYCIVKKARGDLVSYPKKEIIGEVKKLAAAGAKEIWLTSQDCGAYGIDAGENLPELIKEVAEIPGDFFVRIGMMNPNHAKNILWELIKSYKNPKVYKFLHLPVQSGDDKVLKDMNRFYNREDFVKVINAFRKEIPDITISTDVICGYPTEDEEAFKKTISLLKEIKPDVLNISRFWARPHTAAAKLRQHQGTITNQRSREAAELFKKIAAEKNNPWVGWKGIALVSEKGKNKTFMARNYAYKPIVIASKKNILGEFVKAKITKNRGYYLEGEII